MSDAETRVSVTNTLSARSWREAAAVLGGLALLTVFMTYPLVLWLPRALPGGLGDPLLNTWTLAWVASRLPYGLQGVWEAPIFFPYHDTLAFSEHLIGIALFTASVQWMSGNPILAYNAAFLGSYVLAGGGMYLLARWLTGRRDAAWLAALAFAFHPYRVVHVAHLQVLMWGWMPIALWALHRYFAKGCCDRRMLVAFAGAFVLQGLSNGYFLYFFAVAVSIAATFEVSRCANRRRALAHLAAVAALVLIVLAPVASAYSRVRRDYGLTRPRNEAVFYSADIASYAQTTKRLSLWGRWLPQAPGERELFPGLAVPALAAMALLPLGSRAAAERRHLTRIYGVIALAAFALSLGPEPRAWGHLLMSAGPYDWLRQVVPGFDGLRVPARFAAIVYLALTVLGALGAARLLAALPRHAAGAITVALTLVVLAEGYACPEGLSDFRPVPAGHARRAYQWLRDAPAGAVLELPFGTWEQDWQLERELRYQYATLLHRKRIVNGYSGHYSPLRQYLLHSPALLARELPVTVEALRALGVRYIVLHLAEYADDEEAAALHGALWALGHSREAQVVERKAFGDVVVFRLAEWQGSRPTEPAACLRRIDRSEFDVTASDAAERLDRLFDGNIGTRWLSGRAQTGDEWILVTFRRPQDVALVRLEMEESSGGDYPRELIVEGQPVQETGMATREGFVTFYQGRVLAHMLFGLLHDPVRAPIEIPLPPNRIAALRLRQTGRTQPWFWSINELVLCAR